MSKKKRRYERHKKRHGGNPKACDVHHILFIRRQWSQGYAKAIRQFHYCMISLPKNTVHRAIHEGMSLIPVPSNTAARGAYEQLLLLDRYGVLRDTDPIEKRLALLIALFDCVAQPTADGLRKQLAIIQKYKNKPP